MTKKTAQSRPRSASNLRFNSKFWLKDKKSTPEEECTRPCEWPGCDGHGTHRAPRSRKDLTSTAADKYYWFCLDHVRDYNQRWNYYQGMDENEVELDRRWDTTWRRPTWEFAKGQRPGGPRRPVNDKFGFFNEKGHLRDEDDDGLGRAAMAGLSPDLQEAFAAFDVHPGISEDELKSRYKVLVKKYHPDANNGDKAAEEKFKLINNAYRAILKWLRPASD